MGLGFLGFLGSGVSDGSTEGGVQEFVVFHSFSRFQNLELSGFRVPGVTYRSTYGFGCVCVSLCVSVRARVFVRVCSGVFVFVCSLVRSFAPSFVRSFVRVS